VSFYHISFPIFENSGKTYKHTASIILTAENMGKKIGHTVFLDPQDLEFLKEKSVETGRSLSTLIREAVKEYIKREKAKSTTPLERGGL